MRGHHHDPVVPGTEWQDWNAEGGDVLTASQVGNYSLLRPGSVYGGWIVQYYPVCPLPQH